MSREVIRDVGETLVELLRSQLAGLVNASQEIALTSPVNAAAQQIRLTLFLYSISPSAELRNAPPVRVAPGQERRPPLPLDLYYLMTSFGRDTVLDPTERSLEADRLLGAAMRVFYDNGIVSGSLLRGIIPRDTELRLTLQPITVEDLTRLWSVLPDQAYRPSVSYLVTPARIDSQVVLEGQRVVTAQMDFDTLVATASEVG